MSLVLVVTVVVFIVSEKVTKMLSLIETPLWFSVGEIDETVTSAMTGAVVSVVDSSFSSLQEMTVKLKRKRERIMRRCFIGFLIGYFRNTLNIPELGVDYNVWGFYLEGV